MLGYQRTLGKERTLVLVNYGREAKQVRLRGVAARAMLTFRRADFVEGDDHRARTAQTNIQPMKPSVRAPVLKLARFGNT